MARSDHRKRAVGYPFIAVPVAVLTSDEWAGMSQRSRVLMLDLAGQYGGRNNGRLCPAFTAMQRSGWTSKDQLRKARDELLETPFAVRTRMGHPPSTPEWVGLTWWKLDWHQSMDIAPTGWPLMAFAMKQAVIDPNEGRKRPPAKRNLSPARRGDTPRKTGSSPPPCGAMAAAG